MKKFILVAALSCVGWAPQSPATGNTIIRDDRGIPHVYGKTDADAVFGVMYAQAEDDFNRVETNYLNAMGRLAESEGGRPARCGLLSRPGRGSHRAHLSPREVNR